MRKIVVLGVFILVCILLIRGNPDQAEATELIAQRVHQNFSDEAKRSNNVIDDLASKVVDATGEQVIKHAFELERTDYVLFSHYVMKPNAVVGLLSGDQSEICLIGAMNEVFRCPWE